MEQVHILNAAEDDAAILALVRQHVVLICNDLTKQGSFDIIVDDGTLA